VSRQLGVLAGVLLLLGCTAGQLGASPATATDAAPASDPAPAPTVEAVLERLADGAEALLARAADAATTTAYRGRLTVVSFTPQGPTLAAGTQARGAGAVLLAGGGTELGRVDGQGFLRSATGLLTVGGVERTAFPPERLTRRYEARLEEVVELDTGPAQAIALHRRQDGSLRERWYSDLVTGLVVRRETFGSGGRPVRLLAFTELDPGGPTLELPAPEGRSVDRWSVTPGEVTGLREAGFTVPRALPGGFALERALEVPGGGVPTAHLVYHDGLYTLSIFQQLGRLAHDHLEPARRADDGALRWSWSDAGSQRLVWHGAGTTFSAYSDASIDDLLGVVAALPADPAPGLLERVGRGLVRLARLLVPG